MISHKDDAHTRRSGAHADRPGVLISAAKDSNDFEDLQTAFTQRSASRQPRRLSSSTGFLPNRSAATPQAMANKTPVRSQRLATNHLQV